ncbi:MAG: LysR family transcriptional regulator [Firmicutes bacterium]|nr:LysR family transcriptional regulator [Bacillota bacterium]
MDFRLTVFLAVARAGNLTQASRSLNLSPSAASNHIAALERELGATLFRRGRRGMELTPSGQVLLASAQDLESLWQKAVRDVRAEAEGVGRVRLAASHTAAELFLPLPLGRFRAKWPTVRLSLTMTNSADVVALVEQGAVDLGIIETGSLRYRRLHHESLWRDELTFIVSTRHPLARKAQVSIHELLSLDWILREEGSGTRRVFERALERQGYGLHQLTVIMQLDSVRAIVAMVRHNVGVSVVSRALFLHHDLDALGIKALPVDGLNMARTLDAIWPVNRPTTAVTELLAELRRDVARLESRLERDLHRLQPPDPRGEA